MTDIARNIKHTRLARGMNQEQLAEALGVTRQTVSNWERSASNPELTQQGSYTASGNPLSLPAAPRSELWPARCCTPYSCVSAAWFLSIS